MCLAAEGLGRRYPLHARRPGPEINRRALLTATGVEWRAGSADLPSGASHVIAAVVPPKPALIRVDIVGPLDQRAGFADQCGGWSDGHDAIAERLCAAFAEADVLLVVDSPGGAAAGLQQGAAKALAAKAKYGRRVTVWANEMIGSAAMWWACAIGDEMFTPPAGMIGSIGARGEHVDCSGALAKEGLVKTYFADPPDKIALAPEFPLSKAGAARGSRDVKIAADAFRAAVCGSPLGLRNKLTPEALIALGADMLTGNAAVAAGLCDGVASEDEVTAYALKAAETATKTSSSAQARARVETRTMTIRSEEEARARAGDPPDDPDAPEVGAGIPTACANCSVENPVAAKFCMGCGQSMATKPAADGDPDAPPSSKPGEQMTATRMPSAASFAAIFGLDESASLPAQKAVALDYQQVFAVCSTLTGHRTAPGILSGLRAISKDAADTGRMRAERNKLREDTAKVERFDLCKRLVACNGESRGRVFVDHVSTAGERTAPPSLTNVYAEMRIETLRTLVADHEKGAKPRDPFVPDPAEAEARARNPHRDGDIKSRVERAKSDPAVLRMFNMPGNTHSLDAIAAQHVKTIDQQRQPSGGAS